MSQTLSPAEAEAYLDKLIGKEILKEEAKLIFVNMVNEKDLQISFRSYYKDAYYTNSDLSKALVLQFCAKVFMNAQIKRLQFTPELEDSVPVKENIKSTKAFYFSPFDVNGKVLEKDYVDPHRSTVGYTRSKTLKDVLDIGLISLDTYKECSARLKDSTITDEPELFAVMTEKTIYEQFYEFNKKEQEEYLVSLVNDEIIPADAPAKILGSLKPFELKTIPEILNYSPRYLYLDLRSFQPKPEVVYPFIFEKLKRLIPGFSYSDLNISLTEKKEFDMIEREVKMSFKTDSGIYRHAFFFDFKPKPSDKKKSDLPIVSTNFHVGINKWLADKGSLYRLYTVNLPEKEEGAWGNKKIGMLLLKEGEAKKISEFNYFLSYESYDTRLSKRGIERLLKQLTNLGFFDHLSKEEMDKAMVKISETEIRNFGDLVGNLPSMIVMFDWETANLKDPYKELTLELAKATRGAVTVTRITDEFKKGWKEKKEVKYGFTMNGKKYETFVPFNGDWLAPEFLELFDKALRESEVNGEFYYCVDGGQVSGYIFLTAAQHKFIIENYPDLIKG